MDLIIVDEKKVRDSTSKRPVAIRNPGRFQLIPLQIIPIQIIALNDRWTTHHLKELCVLSHPIEQRMIDRMKRRKRDRAAKHFGYRDYVP